MTEQWIDILLIEPPQSDGPRLRSRLAERLETCRLESVDSLDKGLRHLAQRSFDLVLVEHWALDGQELGALCTRGDDPGQRAAEAPPVVVLLRQGSESLAVEMLRGGASDFVITDEAGCWLAALPARVEKVVEARRAEQSLPQSEAHYRAVFENASDAICILEGETCIDCNPAALRIFGRTREQMLGSAPYRFSPLRQPDGENSLVKAEKYVRAAMAGHSQMFEWVHLRQDGTPFDAEVSLNRVQVSGKAYLLGVARDVTERKRAERELKDYASRLEVVNQRLREVHAAAEVASRSKSEFLANVSHEIRTPLTAISGYAEVILTEGDLTRAPRHRIEAVNTILRNTRYLLELIDDILDLSKIEAGRFEVEQTTCRPVQLVAEVERLMQLRAEQRGLPLVVQYDGPVPETIQTDPTRLRQVLINLLSNALKFTEKGEVRLVTRLLDQDGPDPRLQFEVIDTGIGMSPEQVERVFAPFQQADTSTTRRFGGTGLGLTICKRLIEMLGGTIEVETAPGRGSTFRVALAIGSLHGVSLVEHPVAQCEWLADTPEPVPAEAALPTGCRVLLAEDAPDNQRLIAFLLQKAGAEVALAADGASAVEMALEARRRAHPFDVVLMDMQMPVLDGYQATRRLREQGYEGPILALSANAMAGQREACLQAGCDDFLAKPIQRAVLIRTVAEYSARGAQQVRPSSGSPGESR